MLKIRKRTDTLPVRECHILNNLCGIGDVVASLPTFKWLERTAKERKFKYIVFTYFKEDLFDYFFDPASEVIKFLPIEKMNKSSAYRNGQWTGLKSFHLYPTTLHCHAVDYVPVFVADYNLRGAERNYPRFPVEKVNLDKFEIDFSNCIALSVTATQKIKQFFPEAVRDVAAWIKSNTSFQPLFLGSSKLINEHLKLFSYLPEGTDTSIGINLINKTTVPEAVAILSKVKCIVGMDGGMIHLAGMTDTPIVCGYTHTRPEDKMPVRNGFTGWNCFPVTPEDSLDCRFCMYSRKAVHEDFSYCMYDDYKCALTGPQFIAQLERVISEH